MLARPDDVPSLAAAARRAIGLPRTAARHRAEQICDAGRMVDSYETLYRAMAGSTRAFDWPVRLNMAAEQTELRGAA